MNDDVEVRQDRPVEHRGRELTPEEDALRIQQLKASRQSHHAAGGCAEDLPKPAPKDEAGVGAGPGGNVSASASIAIERVQSQKTSDDTGNY